MEQDRFALFDMDNSLADFSGAMRRDLELLRSPSEPELPENLYDLAKQPYTKNRMRVIKSVPGWWLALNPIEAGFWVMNQAHEMGYKIHILTKGPTNHPVAWKEKVEWCNQNIEFPYEMHIVSNKGLMYGTFLYDDYANYMNSWLEYRPRGLGIMPVNSSNESYNHPQVVKWDGTNKEEVLKALQSAYDRKPNGTVKT